MKWFLIVGFHVCYGIGIDDGLVHGLQCLRRVPMPSLEACLEMRNANEGSKCVPETSGTDRDAR